MGSIKFEKGCREWFMFQDYWKLCQKFWILEEDNDDYWDSLIKEAGEFGQKYKDIDLSKKLWLGFIDYLQEQYREKRRKENDFISI